MNFNNGDENGLLLFTEEKERLVDAFFSFDDEEEDFDLDD